MQALRGELTVTVSASDLPGHVTQASVALAWELQALRRYELPESLSPAE